MLKKMVSPGLRAGSRSSNPRNYRLAKEIAGKKTCSCTLKAISGKVAASMWQYFHLMHSGSCLIGGKTRSCTQSNSPGVYLGCIKVISCHIEAVSFPEVIISREELLCCRFYETVRYGFHLAFRFKDASVAACALTKLCGVATCKVGWGRQQPWIRWSEQVASSLNLNDKGFSGYNTDLSCVFLEVFQKKWLAIKQAINK